MLAVAIYHSDDKPITFDLIGLSVEAAEAFRVQLDQNMTLAELRGEHRYWVMAAWDPAQVLVVDPRDVQRVVLRSPAQQRTAT